MLIHSIPVWLRRLFLLRLILSITAEPSLLSVLLGSPVSSQWENSLPTVAVRRGVFTGAKQDPNCQGQLKVRGFEGEMKKQSCTWQDTVPLIP